MVEVEHINLPPEMATRQVCPRRSSFEMNGVTRESDLREALAMVAMVGSERSGD